MGEIIEESEIEGLKSRYKKISGILGEKIFPWICNSSLFPPILKAIEVKPQNIIELMCGNAHLGMFLKKCFSCRLTVVDFCPEMLEQIKDPNVIKKEADARYTGLSKKYDLVVIRFGLQDIQEYEQVKVIKEAYHLLKQGGQFILIAHSATPKTEKAINNILRFSDRIRGIGPRRYICTLGCNIRNMQEAGFLQPIVTYNFYSDISYGEEEIQEPLRTNSWRNDVYIRLCGDCGVQTLKEIGVCIDEPWRYKIPGAIISARK